MSDYDDLDAAALLTMLETFRFTLTHLEDQNSKAGSLNITPANINQVRDTRTKIEQIKAELKKRKIPIPSPDQEGPYSTPKVVIGLSKNKSRWLPVLALLAVVIIGCLLISSDFFGLGTTEETPSPSPVIGAIPTPSLVSVAENTPQPTSIEVPTPSPSQPEATPTTASQPRVLSSTTMEIFACWTGDNAPDGVAYMNIVNKEGTPHIFIQTSCQSGEIIERITGQFDRDENLIFQRNGKTWVVRMHPNRNGTLQTLIDDEDKVFREPQRPPVASTLPPAASMASPTAEQAANPIVLCNDEFTRGEGECWEKRNGADKLIVDEGFGLPYAIKMIGNTPNDSNPDTHNSLAQWVDNLPEGATVTVRAWVKDGCDGQCRIHLRAHNGSGKSGSKDSIFYEKPGRDWTLLTLPSYTVDSEKKMRLIIDMKGTGSIFIGRVEAEWRQP